MQQCSHPSVLLPVAEAAAGGQLLRDHTAAANWSCALVLRSPTLQKYSAYATWIDVYVTLTGPPVSTLTGVLGSTFKAAASTASTGKALSGTLSARVQ